VPASEALISNTVWHGCSRCPLCFKTGLEATFSRLCPLGCRNYLEPGARAARGSYVAWVLVLPVLFQNGPRGDLLTPVPFRGLKISRARSPCRSRVLRGMGARNARFVSKRASRRPSHACTLPRAEVIPSQESVPLEGSPCFARDRAIKCSIVEAAVLRRGRAFLGVAAAHARVVGGVGRRM
jgi:hypothetical protein